MKLNRAEHATSLSMLKAVAAGWDGYLVCRPEEWWRSAPAGVAMAPFTCSDLGVDWEARAVYYSHELRLREKRGFLPALIHEMGHVFACKVPPDDTRCDEWPFFGWEHALACQLGFEWDWIEANRDYTIDGKQDLGFGDLDEREWRSVLKERRAAAERLGLVVNGVPQCIREAGQ